MFGHLSGRLGHEDLGNDKTPIDVYIFMLQVVISGQSQARLLIINQDNNSFLFA